MIEEAIALILTTAGLNPNPTRPTDNSDKPLTQYFVELQESYLTFQETDTLYRYDVTVNHYASNISTVKEMQDISRILHNYHDYIIQGSFLISESTEPLEQGHVGSQTFKVYA